MQIDYSKGASVAFSNYNYAFLYFNRVYVNLCLSVAKTMNLRTIEKLISTFMSEFNYAIPNKEECKKYSDMLKAVSEKFENDYEFNYILQKEELSFKEEVLAYPKYYKYFLEYLHVLSVYVSDLYAYLPRTNYQQKLLQFKNDSPFYDKLHEYKAQMYNDLSGFTLFKFRNTFNSFVMFFYAYKSFINSRYSNNISQMIDLIVNLFVEEEVIRVLSKYPEFSKEDIKFIQKKERIIHEGILYCNSLINDSLSSFGVLPKLRRKVYSDRTLI